MFARDRTEKEAVTTSAPTAKTRYATHAGLGAVYLPCLSGLHGGAGKRVVGVERLGIPAFRCPHGPTLRRSGPAERKSEKLPAKTD